MIDRPWQSEAACRDVKNPEVFFADRPTNSLSDRDAIEQARAICDGCPVWALCLDTVLSLPRRFDQHGVFGGLTPKERADLRDPTVESMDITHLVGGPGERRKGDVTRDEFRAAEQARQQARRAEARCAS